MPSLSIPNSFSPNTTILSASMNANFNAVATLLNSTLLANDNIQAGGISTANLADNSVTGAKLNSNTVDGSTLQYTSSQLSVKGNGITSTQLSSQCVITSAIADAAVTQAKRAALGQVVATTSGTQNTIGGTFTDLTNQSITLTTTGRPIYLALQPTLQNTGNNAIGTTGVTDNLSAWLVRFLEDGSEIARFAWSGGKNANNDSYIPPALTFIRVGASSASHTYKAQMMNQSTTGNAFVQNVQLVAFEL